MSGGTQAPACSCACGSSLGPSITRRDFLRYAGAATAAASMGSLSACLGEASSRAVEKGKRVIVLGFDGVDWRLARKLMAQGRMPNFERMARRGMAQPLATSIPPLSPVAWSTFITGMDPAGHGIFEFTHRDPRTLRSFSSTSRTEQSDSAFGFGGWRFPLGGAKVELLRHGTPFWKLLHDRDIPTTIIRMPANFPPSGVADRELSGMGTPDLLGTNGSYSFFSSDPLFPQRRTSRGGQHIPLERSGNIATGELVGPANPMRTDRADLVMPFRLVVDPVDPVALLRVGDQERMLRVGEWSDWVPLSFHMAPTQSLAAAAIFHLKSLHPHIELYVSPLQVDPMAPSMPLSTPKSYAAELAQATGRFYTQTQPEDAEATVDESITRDEFLEQAELVQDEQDNQYEYILDQSDAGLLFHYWGYTDQVAHMVWRSMDPDHPTYDPDDDPRYADVLPKLYERADRTVGETLRRLDDDDTLVVMSDHGFDSWRRGFNFNSWLEREGYLTLGGPPRPGALSSLVDNVDWSRTSAYSFGLTEIYINLAGREETGIVSPTEKASLLREIASKLLEAVDPVTGQRIIRRVFSTDEEFHDGPYTSIGPDGIIGYNKHYRSTWESGWGLLETELMKDNTGWTGDHVVDPSFVPGVLFSSRKLPRRVTGLKDLAPAILAEFGVEEDFPVPA